jgi:hypothetical protein
MQSGNPTALYQVHKQLCCHPAWGVETQNVSGKGLQGKNSLNCKCIGLDTNVSDWITNKSPVTHQYHSLMQLKDSGVLRKSVCQDRGATVTKGPEQPVPQYRPTAAAAISLIVDAGTQSAHDPTKCGRT